MAPPPPPTGLIDDVTAEILLRLPPDEPEHLFRAALVCKPWLRIVCDAAFLRRYGVFHGAPPLLGLLHRLQVLEGDPPARFASTTSIPDFPHPGWHPLDCRHGRVLMWTSLESAALLVWDPVTGDRHAVPWPDMDYVLIESAAVLCARDGCDHLDCHGGPFRVVFLATHDFQDDIFATMYSSETGAWTVPISLEESCEESFAQHMREGIAGGPLPFYTPYLQPRRGTLVGDGVFFTIRFGNAIVRYDWAKNRLSMINAPSRDVYYISLMAMDNSTLGFACILSSSLHTWSRRVDTEESSEWVQYRVIELEKMVPVANPDDKQHVVGFAEGVGIIFVSTCAGLFAIKLNSGQVRKVDESWDYFSVLPYMSFYTPDRGRLLSLARAH